MTYLGSMKEEARTLNGGFSIRKYMVRLTYAWEGTYLVSIRFDSRDLLQRGVIHHGTGGAIATIEDQDDRGRNERRWNLAYG
jgi:hypothetical protein